MVLVVTAFGLPSEAEPTALAGDHREGNAPTRHRLARAAYGPLSFDAGDSSA